MTQDDGRLVARLILTLPRTRARFPTAAVREVLELAMLVRTLSTLSALVKATPAAQRRGDLHHDEVKQVICVAVQELYQQQEASGTLDPAASGAHEDDDDAVVDAVGDAFVNAVLDHMHHRCYDYEWHVQLQNGSQLQQIPVDKELASGLEVAYSSGLGALDGSDWSADLEAMTLTCSGNMWALCRSCVGRRHVPSSSGAMPPKPAPPSMCLRRKSSADMVHWLLRAVGSSGYSDGTDPPIVQAPTPAHALRRHWLVDPALSHQLEWAFQHWMASGCLLSCVVVPNGPDAIVVFPSSTTAWQVRLGGDGGGGGLLLEAVRLVTSVDDDDDDDDTQQWVTSSFNDLPSTTAAAASLDGLLQEDKVAIENVQAVYRAAVQRNGGRCQEVDAEVLFFDVARYVATHDMHCMDLPLLLTSSGDDRRGGVLALMERLRERGNIVLGAVGHVASPTVELVQELLRFSFVSPAQFLLAPEVAAQVLSGHEMLWEGHWIPLGPLNEWLLWQDYPRLFLDGGWAPVRFMVAQMVRTNNDDDDDDSPPDHERDPVRSSTVNVWLRRKGENPIRLVCRGGVPMSLDRRVLLSSQCPSVFLEPDAVIYDESLDPIEVQRTWSGGRSDLRVVEFFGIGREARRFSTHMLTRGEAPSNAPPAGGGHQKHATAKSSIAARLAAGPASKYQYKFPLLPTLL